MVSVVPDLLTATRIAATAKQLGIEHLAARPEEAVALCRRTHADLVVVDLEAPGDPNAMVRRLKQDPATAAIPVLAFYPHVRNALRESALAAGADQVLPRSAFSRKLVQLLAGEGDTPE